MASEKELNIKINTDADSSTLENLVGVLEELKSSSESLNLNPDTSGMDDASSSAQNVANSVGEATNGVEELKNSADGVSGSGFDDMAESIDDVNKNLGDVKQNQLDIGSGAMLNFVSSNLQSVSTGAETMAHDMNEASITVGQLATQTHMSEDAMVGLVNNISNVTFPNDEAMMYIKNLSQMGVDSKNFAKSATDIDKMNDAFHLGASTTNSMATELAVLGVDMNNASSSFNALAYANANTKGGMENFYTFLRKYDADLNQMGYDVDQTAIIIAGATQKYGGGRAALSGLSNALKNAGGDARALEKELGLQAGSLDNASQITGEYEGQLQALASEEMEHKTLVERLGAVWEDLSLSLGTTLSPLLSVVGVFSQMGSIGLGYQGIKVLSKDLLNLKKNVGGMGGILNATKTKITDFASTVKGKFTGFGTIFSDERGTISTLGTKFTDLKNKIVTNLAIGINKIKDFGSSLKGNLIDSFNGAKTKIVEFSTTLKSSLVSSFNSVKTSISSTKTKIVEFGSTLKGNLISSFNTAKTKAIEFATTLKTNIVSALSNVKTRIIGLATTLKTTLVTAFNGAVTKAKELALGLLDLGKKALISGYNALKSAGMWLVEKASLIASAIGKGIATASSWALAVAEWAVASPILIIVGLVLVLIGVLIYLYMTNENVRNTINGLGQTFIEIGQMIYNAMMNAVNMVISYLTQLWNYIVGIGQWILSSVGITGNSIMASVLGFIVFMATLPLQLGIILTNAIARLLGFKGNFVQTLLSTAVNGVRNFVGNIGGMANKLRTELQNMLSIIGEWAKTLPDKFWQAGVNAVKQFLSALGINSPGIMQRTMEWEITEMGNRVPKQSEGLISNVTKMGANVVDSFGEPKLGIGIEDNIKNTISNLNLNGLLNIDGLKKNDLYTNDNNEQVINNVTSDKESQSGKIFNINVEVGTVDNEDRVNEIAEAVKKTLMFENSTAGRGV